MSFSLRYALPLIVIAVASISAVALTQLKKPPAEKDRTPKTPVVRTIPIELSPIQITVDSYGTVNPQFDTVLVAQISGEIAHINEAFVRGGFVRKGDTLVTFAADDYQALLTEAQAALASAQAALKLERARGHVALEEWKNIASKTPSELSLRKPQLEQEVARVKGAEAGVQRARKNLDRTTIKAPFNGLIAQRDVGIGGFVNVGGVIGRILSSDLAEIRLPLSSRDMQFLDKKGIGAKVKLTTEQVSGNVEWTANIVREEGVVDASSRMTYLVAQIYDPYGLKFENNSQKGFQPLRFGAYVTAKIQGIQIDHAARIPRHLVDSESRVPILNAKNTLTLKPVKIQRREGRNVIVSEGLEDQDELIISALSSKISGIKLEKVGENAALPALVPTQNTSANPPSSHSKGE